MLHSPDHSLASVSAVSAIAYGSGQLHPPVSPAVSPAVSSSPSPSPSQSQSSSDSDIPHSPFPIPHSSGLPSPEDVAAIASLDNLGRAARLFEHYESCLERRALADAADGKLPSMAELNNQILGFWRLTAVRKTLAARRYELEAREAQRAAAPAPDSKPEAKPMMFSMADLRGTYAPRSGQFGGPDDDTQNAATLRGWLRRLSGCVHLDPLNQLLKICMYEAWKDLSANDPQRLARMHPYWEYSSCQDAPDESLLMHWVRLHTPDPTSPDGHYFEGLSPDGDRLVWPAGGAPVECGPSDPNPPLPDLSGTPSFLASATPIAPAPLASDPADHAEPAQATNVPTGSAPSHASHSSHISHSSPASPESTPPAGSTPSSASSSSSSPSPAELSPSVRAVPACPTYSEPALARALANTQTTLTDPTAPSPTPSPSPSQSIPPSLPSPIPHSYVPSDLSPLDIGPLTLDKIPDRPPPD